MMLARQYAMRSRRSHACADPLLALLVMAVVRDNLVVVRCVCFGQRVHGLIKG